MELPLAIILVVIAVCAITISTDNFKTSMRSYDKDRYLSPGFWMGNGGYIIQRVC